MPYTVNNIIHEQEVVTVSKNDSVLMALSLMNQYDLSQLAVIDEARHPLGMVTYESILKGLRNFNLRVEELKVGNVLIHAYYFHLEDTLSDLLERLKSANAVLILASDSTIAGIVTTYDATEYFRRYAEDLMLVEDVESMMKDLIRLSFEVYEDEDDSDRLQEAIRTCTRYKNGKSFKKLTFNEYMNLLLIEDNWPFMQKIFDMPSPESVRSLLDAVRRTRNDLAHFQGEITSDQRDQLRFCADWLGRCQSEYEARIELERQKEALVIPIEAGTIQEAIAEEPIPSDSRYAPLGNYLQGQPGNIDQLQMTFSEIEEIIGGSLPPSAYNHRNWWDNTPEVHTQSSSWLEAGWRVGYRNISAKTITFVRIKEREKAYIDFFSSLLQQVRENGSVPVRDASPDGTSWIVVVQEAQITFFGFSFARGRRFRVELYLDTGDQGTTKQIFDRLYDQKETTESAMGPLSWERLDDKRASRIALYHSGEITDSEKKLESLKKWGVETMVKLYTTLALPLQEITSKIQ
jgi:CBS domain-containing protein